MRREVTKHEILMSIIIALLFIAFGVLISSSVENYCRNKNERFLKVPIAETIESFNYCKNTSVQEVFSPYQMTPIKAVTLPELNGEFLAIKKYEEHYNTHVEHYTTTDSKGRVHSHTRIRYSWDLEGKDEFLSQQILFNGNEINFNNLLNPLYQDIDLSKIINSNFKCYKSNSDYIYENSKIRYSYEVIPFETTGSCLVSFKDGEVEKVFLDHCDDPFVLQQAQLMSVNFFLVVFWGLWTPLGCFVIYKFVMMENEWLE